MSLNPGENFRKKLVVVLEKFGTTVSRHRPAYTDALGVEHPESTVNVKVLDTDSVGSNFTEIRSFFNIGGTNQNDPDMIELIYAAESGSTSPTRKFKKALIDEGDELYFDGFVHEVTRQKPLPIAGVNCFRHVACTKVRPIL